MTGPAIRVFDSLLCCFLSAMGAFVLSGCAAIPDRTTEWIQAGKTTKPEVLERYGEPDLVQVLSDGEIATYRPIKQRPSLDVPVAQAGPLGTTTTKTQTITPGLGVSTVERPGNDIRILYDAQGIVREVR